MFEITYTEKTALEYYVKERIAYKNAEYDFTFENRYIIYHTPLRNRIVYLALDMNTNRSSEVCSRREGKYLKHEYPNLIPQIFKSIKYTGDKRVVNAVALNPNGVIESIFRVILPNYGFTVREEQIKLCKKMFEGLTSKQVAICEAEVGTGKSLAYLIAAVCAKKYNAAFHIDEPITITTSNIELQNALIEKEIPCLSQMLEKYHIIDEPLTAVLRKGKEHYFCRSRYEDFMEKISRTPEKYGDLISYFITSQFADKAFDLDKTRLSGSLKGKICVKGQCGRCPYKYECKYNSFIDRAMGDEPLDFQVTNHNLYLMSAKTDRILRNTSLVIVDEAHKLKEAANDVYGEHISENDIIKYLNWSKTLCNNRVDLAEFRKLREEVYMLNTILFEKLREQSIEDDNEGGAGTIIKLSNETISVIEQLADSLETLDGMRRKHRGRCEISAKVLCASLKTFTRPSRVSVWIEIDENDTVSLCCCSKDVDVKLMKNVWNRLRSHVLTSGTMSDGKEFEFFKRENGLDRVAKHLLIESSTPSPFNYAQNTRLYIPNDMPMPNSDNENYINAVADKVVKLIRATNGHTAILFTSYKVLHKVYELTYEQLKDYEVICMTRSNKTAIADFKKSKNGVLFASGSMWEGVDCVGDCLSSVIIVRLPFPLRTATMEEKKSSCESIPEFIQEYAVPEMLIKLRQGAGRLIRCESDTGLLSILDARASSFGNYRERVLDTLGKYPLVESIDEAEQFMKSVKSDEYYKN